MQVNPPKQVTWIIALVLGILGILGYLVEVAVLTDFAFWFVVLGLALMLLATIIKDL